MERVLNLPRLELNLALTAIFITLVANLLSRLVWAPDRIAVDVAMYFQAAQLILAGKAPYLDFWDINPPLIMYLSIVPVLVHNVLGVSAVVAINSLVLSLTVLGCYLIAISDRRRTYAQHLMLLIGYIFASWVAVVGLHFAQREHLFVIVFIPYLFLRWQPAPERTRWTWVAVFLSALMGCLKPSFLALMVIAELIRFYQKRSVRFEYLSAWILPLLLYIGIFALLPRAAFMAFWTEHVPLVLERYHTFDQTWVLIWKSWKGYFICTPPAAIALFVLARKLKADLLQCFAVLQLVTFVSIVGTFKAWGYHLLVLNGLLAVGCALAWIQLAQWPAKKRYVSAVLIFALTCGPFIDRWKSYMIHPLVQSEVEWLNFRERKFSYVPAESKVVVFSGDPTLIYPMLLLNHQWPGSRYLMMYPLAFFNNTPKRIELLKSHYPTPAELEPREHIFVQEIADDLVHNKPDMVYFAVDSGYMLPPGFSSFEYGKSVGWYDLIKNDYDVVSENQFGRVFRRKTR